MKYSIVFPLSLILTAVAVWFFCSDLPAPADSVPGTLTPDITLFAIDNFPVVDESGSKDFGIVVDMPQQVTSITISSSCEDGDTVLSIQSPNTATDTIYFTKLFTHAGQCTLQAHAASDDVKLNNKVVLLPLRVVASQQIINDGDSDTNKEPATKTETDPVTDEVSTNALTPTDIYAPENIFAGKADTLHFSANGAHGETISLTTAESLDPAVFTVVSPGPEVVRIAINPDAATGSAQIGIAVSKGEHTDTTIYPVTLTDPKSSLWNRDELSIEAIEGAEITCDLNAYLNNPEAVITSDIGMVSEDNIWAFTPPWGSEEAASAKIKAKTANKLSVLTLNITIPAGDLTPPELSIIYPTQDRISENQITVKCNAADSESGVAKVILTCGDQIVEAVAQDETTFSGVITGLVNTVPTEITITAIDNSRTKNQAQHVLTIQYDSTMTDKVPPTIELLSDIVSGQRITVPEGTLSYTVTDGSGVDSVWWTLNGTFGGIIPLLEDDTYNLTYALTRFGDNSISVIAQDGTVNNNSDTLTIRINYNVAPIVPIIETPESGALSVATTTTLTWTEGDDPDEDSVFYQVLYKKSTETNFKTVTESPDKSAELQNLEPTTEYTWKVLAYTKTYPDTVLSEPATFTTAGIGPAISKQPTEPTEAIQPDGSFTLTVEASGNPEPTYQWYKDGVSISGATEATFSVTSASKDDAGEYYVVITNDAGEVKSSTASITIQKPVAITTDPEAQDVNAGENVTFTVKATGDGSLKYQWMKNGSPVSGQTSATLTLTAVTTNQAGTYTCMVSNEFSEKTSKGARLKVTPTYTLTYDKNGGNGNVPSPEKHPSGSNASIKNYNGLSKNGLTCIGWGDNINLYKGGSTITMTKDITLWAVWQATVTFDYQENGRQKVQATAIEGRTIHSGNIPDIAIGAPNRSNTATFEGWFTAKTGGQPFNTGSEINKSMTVYAHWKKIQYEVTFEDITDPIYVDAGSTVGKQCPPDLDDTDTKTFEGWANFSCDNTTIKHDMTVSAVWDDIITGCSVIGNGPGKSMCPGDAGPFSFSVTQNKTGCVIAEYAWYVVSDQDSYIANGPNDFGFTASGQTTNTLTITNISDEEYIFHFLCKVTFKNGETGEVTFDGPGQSCGNY